MKKQEIKKLSKDEVLKNIDKLKKDLFNFRFQRINSEIKDPSKIGQTKKNDSKIKNYTKRKIKCLKRY
jgi:large subunit ribosomal protein L29